MNINWKIKSLIFSAVDYLNAHRFLYFLQKNVTKRSANSSSRIKQSWVWHRKNLEERQCTDLIFEFGAGKNLAQNIYLSEVVGKQVVVDINQMLDFDLIERARVFLNEEVNLRVKKEIRSFSDLAEIGIVYKAPYDARETDFHDNVVDACVSTNTLEHIPLDSIVQIFNELRRILKKDGVVSAKIDYSDHYAHTDKNITLLNFLRFSDKEWVKYNHRCHFQNRLRHYQYRDIFTACGFSILSEHVAYEEKNVPPEISERYSSTEDSWAATSGNFLLVNNRG